MPVEQIASPSVPMLRQPLRLGRSIWRLPDPSRAGRCSADRRRSWLRTVQGANVAPGTSPVSTPNDRADGKLASARLGINGTTGRLDAHDTSDSSAIAASTADPVTRTGSVWSRTRWCSRTARVTESPQVAATHRLRSLSTPTVRSDGDFWLKRLGYLPATEAGERRPGAPPRSRRGRVSERLGFSGFAPNPAARAATGWPPGLPGPRQRVACCGRDERGHATDGFERARSPPI